MVLEKVRRQTLGWLVLLAVPVVLRSLLAVPRLVVVKGVPRVVLQWEVRVELQPTLTAGRQAGQRMEEQLVEQPGQLRTRQAAAL